MSRGGASSLLLFDAQATGRVRVRCWRHPGGELPRWSSAAHDAVELAWPDRGELVYRIGRRRLRAGVGEALVVPVGLEHHSSIAVGTEATSIWLDRDLMAEIEEMVVATGGGRLAAGVVSDAPAIQALGRLLCDEARRSDPGALLSADALAEALAVRLLRGAPVDAARAVGRDARIAAALDCVEHRYAEPLTVDELAQVAGMSRFHFSRLFRSHVGMSPYQYLVTTRVRRAAELLRGGRHSVTEAAYHVGFCDLGRFARAFRRQLGCAPSEFRRARASTVAMARSA